MTDKEKLINLLREFGIDETKSLWERQSFRLDGNEILINTDGRLRRVEFLFNDDGSFRKLS